MAKIGDKYVYIGKESPYETNGKVYHIEESNQIPPGVSCVMGDNGVMSPIIETEYLPFSVYNKLIEDNTYFKIDDYVYYIGKNDRMFKYGVCYQVDNVIYDSDEKILTLGFVKMIKGYEEYPVRRSNLFVSIIGFRNLIIDEILEI